MSVAPAPTEGATTSVSDTVEPPPAYGSDQQQLPFKQDPQQTQYMQYGAPYGQPYSTFGPQPYQTNTNVNVVQQQPGVSGAVVFVQPVEPVDTYCILACLTFWFCNCLFGGIAMIFSLMSMSARDGRNVDSARTYGRVSMWLSIIGIISSVILITTIMIIVFASA